MRRLIFWILLIPAVAAFGAFALNNRAQIALDLWPFGILIELPVYLALAISVVIGAVLGGMASWMSSGRARRKFKSSSYEGEVARRELLAAKTNTERLERELATLRGQVRQPRQQADAPPDVPGPDAEKIVTLTPPH